MSCTGSPIYGSPNGQTAARRTRWGWPNCCPGGVEYRFDFAARSFLHNQVRSITGTLERVGAGAWTPEDIRAALQAKDRAACGPVAPPQGLYLVGVTYPVDPFPR